MKIAVISGPRSLQPMGLESAERHLLEAARERIDDQRFKVHVVGGWAARRYAHSLGARWDAAPAGRMPRRAWRSADIVHLIGLDLPPPPGGVFVATVQDLAAVRFDDEGRLPEWTADIVTRAARVVTPSWFTARELEEQFGVPRDRIRVVQYGPGQAVSPATEPLSDAELLALGLHTPFVLRIGGYTRRKNVPVLLAAWPEVRRRTGALLALAGPPQAARGVHLAAAPSLEGVVALDYLPSQLMPRLIRSASALISVSVYEGFGLPPLEAMAAGTPVVAVRSACAEEVCGMAGQLVDDDATAISEGLIGVLQNESLCRQLRENGLERSATFTWERAAEDLLSVYREVGFDPTPSPSSR